MRRRFGHDLIALVDDLIAQVDNSEEYVERPAVRDDLEFMRSDQDLRRVLTLLTEFGKHGRFQRLDEFLDPESVDDDANPYRRWEELELEIVQRRPDWSESRAVSGCERVAARGDGVCGASDRPISLSDRSNVGARRFARKGEAIYGAHSEVPFSPRRGPRRPQPRGRGG